MGCHQSLINSSARGEEEGDRKGGNNIRAYLHTLPKLFAECSVGGVNFLCTCNVNSPTFNIVFACTDSCEGLYQKQVTLEELEEIREALDVNHTIGWWAFFSALKHSFFNRRVVLRFETQGEEEQCLMSIELNFVTLGRTSLSLRLRKASNTGDNSVASMFIYPLYDFYAIRSETAPPDRIAHLEKQVKLYSEKVQYLERKLASGESDSESSEVESEVEEDEELPPETQEEENEDEVLNIPAEHMLKFIKRIKRKLVLGNVISDNEKESFDHVINVLREDKLYAAEIITKVTGNKQLDKEMMVWLKERFGNAANSVTGGVRKKKVKKKETSTNLVTASQYLSSNSQINRTKTVEAIVEMFDRVDDWNFDVFTLNSLTEGTTLFITAYTLFIKYGLLEKFGIDEETLIAFLREIEAGYHPNPYHNSMHAADVTQVLHYVIFKGGLSDLMTDEDVLAALIAAIIHDYDHPGLNNTFQVNSQSYLATLYNDRSVLENHHCAMAFELMRSKQFNILGGLTSEQRKDVRETIVQMVLSTDMAQHAQILGKFKSRIGDEFSDKEDVRLALQLALKCADVSNPARPQELYRKWAARVCDEFYKQGDKERELGLGISPFMDRTKPALAKGQVAFVNYIVQPMFESFASFLPEMSFVSPHIEATKEFWGANETIQLGELREMNAKSGEAV